MFVRLTANSCPPLSDLQKSSMCAAVRAYLEINVGPIDEAAVGSVVCWPSQRIKLKTKPPTRSVVSPRRPSSRSKPNKIVRAIQAQFDGDSASSSGRCSALVCIALYAVL